MTSSPKIIVTGAAGFIGSHVAETLLRAEYQVIGLDNLNDYYFPDLKRLNLARLEKYPGFASRQLDIVDRQQVLPLIKKAKPLFLIHAAARAGVRASVRNPLVYTETNVFGTHVLLEAVRRESPDTKVILLSSSSVYGPQSEVPFREGMIPKPQSPYALSKYLMELLAQHYYQFYRVRLVVIRPFSIYGPRGRPDMAPFLLIRAAERGEDFTQYGCNADNQRDWTYVDDFVAGVSRLMEHFHFSSFEIFNFGNGQPVGIDDLVKLEKKMIKKYLGKELRVVKEPRSREELPITYADIGKAHKLLGYGPQTDLERGLVELFSDYVKRRESYRRIFG